MALTFTHQALANADGNTATGSFAPTAGGVLIAVVGTNSDASVLTSSGTLAGTWVQRSLIQTALYTRTMAVYTCTNYSGSGTVKFTMTGGGAWCTCSVTLALDVGTLSTSSPVKQSATLVGGATTVSLGVAPTYGTFATVAAGGPTTGGGYTILLNDQTWDTIGNMTNTAGGITATASSSSTMTILELNNAGGGAAGSALGKFSLRRH